MPQHVFNGQGCFVDTNDQLGLVVSDVKQTNKSSHRRGAPDPSVTPLVSFTFPYLVRNLMKDTFTLYIQ